MTMVRTPSCNSVNVNYNIFYNDYKTFYSPFKQAFVKKG